MTGDTQPRCESVSCVRAFQQQTSFQCFARHTKTTITTAQLKQATMVCLDIVMSKLKQLPGVDFNAWLPGVNDDGSRSYTVSMHLKNGIHKLYVCDFRDRKVHREFEVQDNGTITIKNSNGSSVLLNADPADPAKADTACFELLQKLMFYCLELQKQ